MIAQLTYNSLFALVTQKYRKTESGPTALATFSSLFPHRFRSR
jgi:hypothetical protein